MLKLHLIDLFSPLGKPADRAIYFTIVISSFYFFYYEQKPPQYLLDRFSRSFHQIEGICVNFLNLVQFFRFLKGRFHGNQFSGKNGAKLPNPLHLSLCHSETELHIVLQIHALIAALIALHRVKRR